MKQAFYIIFFVFTFWFSACAQPVSSSLNNAASPETMVVKVGKAPGSVEIADFNKDKFSDLAITSETDSSVTVLLGNGKGGFNEVPGSPFSAGEIPNDICIADINKDGNMDLAFANHDRQYLTVLLGNGKGHFSPAPKSPFYTNGAPHAHGIATGDFNSDGRLDLVSDSWGHDQIVVLFADNNNGFKTPGTFIKVGRAPYQRVRSADINLDGKMDIVTTNLRGDNTTILLGNGKGNFSEAPGSPFPAGDAPFNHAIGDVNDDGKPDLAIINSPASTGGISNGTNGLTILLGDGKGSFTKMKNSPFEAGKIPNRVAIGDVNGDGVNDVVTSDTESDKIYLFLISKPGTASPGKVITVGNNPKGVAISDLNGDRKGDIVVCNNADNTISIVFSK